MLAALLIALVARLDVDDVVAEARAQLDAGEAEAAAARLELALVDADDIDVRRALSLALVDAHLALDDPTSAAAAIDAFETEERFDVQHALGRVMHYWGDLEAAQGRTSDLDFFYGEARSRFARAIDLAPRGDASALVDALQLELYAYGESADVLKRAEAGLRTYRGDAELHLLAGTARLYELHALEQKHGDTPSRREREQQERMIDEARDDLRRAERALGDERAEPHAQLAWLYEKTGDAQEAVDAAVKAAEVLGDAAPFDTLYRLARRYAIEDELDASATALVAMAEADPDELTAWIESEDDVTAVVASLGRAAFKLTSRRSYATAKTVYRALLEAGPKTASMWNDYALMCRDTRDYAESYRAYAAALAIDDTDPRTLNDTALVLDYHLNRDDEARPLYEKAIRLAEEELKQLGLTTERKAYLRLALRDAKNNLARLR